MFSNNYNSLQESVMEYIVINFKEVFNSYKDRLISKTKLLPPQLFERILHKGKELRWSVNKECLEKLLGYRDVLSWKNIDVMFPIKTLSICLDNITKEGMKNLCNMGSTIEILDLTYISRSTLEFPNASFPKLKKLHLRGSGPDKINLDFERFADTLEEFTMEYDYLSESSMKSLANLRQLKVLSFRFSSKILDDDVFLGVLSSMTKLRTLDLKGSLVNRSQLHLKLPAAISKLSHLENIDVSFNEKAGKEWILQVMKCKKWKRFGMYLFNYCMKKYSHYKDFKPWAEEIFGMYEETMLSTCEIYIRDFRSSLEIPSLMLKQFLPRITDHLPRIENVLLSSLDENPNSGAILNITLLLDTGRCTQNFIRKLINIICSFYDPGCHLRKKANESKWAMCIIENVHVSRTMLNIINKELNKGLSFKILCGLFVFSILTSRYQYQIKMIDSKNVCLKALEDDFISEEVLIIMKKLLEKICMNYVV